MSRVLTFSTQFPSYHPRAGQATHFVEKLHSGLPVEKYGFVWGKETTEHFAELGLKFSFDIFKECRPKYHTVRAGNRWKAGDMFSPRVWSGKPYNSKQISLGPDVQVVKTWDFEMTPALYWDECGFKSKDFQMTTEKLETIAKNDGLNAADFILWFAGPGMVSSKRKPFKGQIICWNEKIDYNTHP